MVPGRPLIRLALIFAAAVLAQAGEWTPSTWRGEPALASEDHGWTATISVPRGRLVSLAHPVGGELIHAPTGTPAELLRQRQPVGGHEMWLAPQLEWGWPPPAAWEYDPPEVAVHDSSVVVAIPASGRFPAMRRTYRWREHALDAALAWSGSGRWAMHILQVPVAAEISLAPIPTAANPAGWAYGLYPDRYRPRRIPASGLPGAIATDGRIVFTAQDEIRKYLAPAQAIRCRYRSGAVLDLERGDATGATSALPDDGLISQVFVGKPEVAYREIEQMSPVMDGPESAFTVRLRPSAP